MHNIPVMHLHVQKKFRQCTVQSSCCLIMRMASGVARSAIASVQDNTESTKELTTSLLAAILHDEANNELFDFSLQLYCFLKYKE